MFESGHDLNLGELCLEYLQNPRIYPCPPPRYRRPMVGHRWRPTLATLQKIGGKCGKYCGNMPNALGTSWECA
ncbi:hypothetical protein SLA2020_041700 [Shorea laevis]